MKKGDKVEVVTLNVTGVISEICGDRVLVVVDNLRYNVIANISDVRTIEQKKLGKDGDIVKYDISKLEIRDEIFDCVVRKWRKVTSFRMGTGGSVISFVAGDNTYNSEGKHEFGKFISVVAIKKREKRELMKAKVTRGFNGIEKMTIEYNYKDEKDLLNNKDVFCLSIEEMTKGVCISMNLAQLDETISSMKSFREDYAKRYCENFDKNRGVKND